MQPILKKSYLLNIAKKFIIFEDLQNYPHMVHMIILTLRVYQDVIYKDNHKKS